jgi:alkanesulfonate monooxygenase SsuD/methylene tetrahydromethanopterin reductase-like flavin-dependent oxidoreductase (luciferase family)
MARVKRGIFLAPFDELADARRLAELAARAESTGWDGFFVWDHVAYRPPVTALADPWVSLAAIACATERLRIGPLVTPLSRRRTQKLARETVTLDRLSHGRLIFGVGLGVEGNGELEPFNEVVDPRERARLLDAGLEQLLRFWDGEFEPRPAQQPRIPVWVAVRWPNRRPLQRAARWDGLFPIGLPDPDALASYLDEIRVLREDAAAPFDVAVEFDPADDTPVDLDAWAAAGATWALAGFDAQAPPDLIQTVIDAGPS